MCRFHGQELAPKLRDTIAVHGQIRKFLLSERAGVSAAGKDKLPARTRWPSQPQSRFANQVLTQSPGAGHKTNRRHRGA